jgi:hypothetical protein
MMNDTELDEMLDRWQAPATRESWREELRAGFAVRAGRAGRRGLLRRMIDAASRVPFGRLAVATVGAVAVFFAVLQVAPRIVRMASPSSFRIPFYVESVFVSYAKNGSVERRSRNTAFPYGGIAFNMSVTELDGSLRSKVSEITGSIRTQIVLAMPSLVLPKRPPMAEPAWFAGFVRSGCSEGRTVVGHEVVAGYETTVTQNEWPTGRVRIWMAPELACFPLKFIREVRRSDGSYQFEATDEVVRVTMNR